MHLINILVIVDNNRFHCFAFWRGRHGVNKGAKMHATFHFLPRSSRNFFWESAGKTLRAFLAENNISRLRESFTKPLNALLILDYEKSLLFAGSVARVKKIQWKIKKLILARRAHNPQCSARRANIILIGLARRIRLKKSDC